MSLIEGPSRIPMSTSYFKLFPLDSFFIVVPAGLSIIESIKSVHSAVFQTKSKLYRRITMMGRSVVKKSANPRRTNGVCWEMSMEAGGRITKHRFSGQRSIVHCSLAL